MGSCIKRLFFCFVFNSWTEFYKMNFPAGSTTLRNTQIPSHLIKMKGSHCVLADSSLLAL